MEGSAFVRGDQPRRRAREALVRSFMRARRSAVRAITRPRQPETAAAQ